MPNERGMSKIRNLPLAVRLAGAFGALIVGLVIVAFVGTHAMNGISGKADSLAKTNLKSAEVLADLQTRAKDDVSLGEQHLYVHDGDLAAQDSVAGDIAADDSAMAKDGTQLGRLFAGSGAADEFATYDQLRQQFVVALGAAVQRSRTETVRKAGDRNGSRGYFEKTVLGLDDRLEKAGTALLAAANQEGDKDAADGNATAASGKQLILIIAVIAVLLAIFVAIAVTRSVVRPVKALSERMTSLEEHCLTDLSNALGAVAEGDLTVGIEPKTAPIEITATDELGKLSMTFNGMLEKAQHSVDSYNRMRAGLGEAIAEVATGAGTVASASQQMASTSDEAGRAVGEIASAVTDVAHGAERQVRMVEATREAVQEAARAAGSSAEEAQATAQAAEQTREVALDGVRAAEQATAAIEQVAESSQRVGAAIEGLSAKSEQIGGIVGHDHRDRRADQPARAQRGDRGRPRR